MSTKRRGRPPHRPPLAAGDPSVPVHLKLPATQYDALYRRAQDSRVSVPERIRRDLRAAKDKE